MPKRMPTQAEGNLERERRAKAELEKSKRKAENELKAASETLDEMHRIRADLESAIKKLER